MIHPPSRALNHLETYSVDENMKRLILFGQKLPLPETKDFILGKPYKVMYKDQLLAIYHIDPENNNQIRALRVFKDRKSTRLNSSHVAISYAVFCLKKKKIIEL